MKLIRCVYELKIMDIFGQGLQSFHCPICGSDKLTRIFDPLSGGILCENCRSKAKKSIHISEDARYVLQYINGATLGNLYNFTVSDSVLEELMMIAKEFLAVYVDRKFNSVEIIESLS